MHIRDEMPSDEAAIEAVIAAAFRDMPYSQQTETFIMAALRRAGALAVSLVAEEDGHIFGQAAFSPVEIDGKPSDWYGAGPIAVTPERQRQGIGSALMEEGLGRLHDLAPAAVLVGDPAWYQRFGFRTEPRLTLEGVPPEVFMASPSPRRFGGQGRLPSRFRGDCLNFALGGAPTSPIALSRGRSRGRPSHIERSPCPPTPAPARRGPPSSSS